MNNILKQSEALGTSSKRSEFGVAVFRLTAYYTAGIFAILLISSTIIYSVFTAAVPAPPALDHNEKAEDQMLDERYGDINIYEIRQHLLDILLIVDLGILVLASGASYFFARETLRPIEEVYKKQERFVGDVAHELRTPLAVLRSGAETMLRSERTPQVYAGFIEESLEEVNRMTRLSDDLLFLLKHKNTAGVALEKVDLSNLVSTQVAHFTPYAAEKGIALHLEVLPSIQVSGNTDALTRLLQNVLKNAIDYNKQHGSVTVSLAQTNQNVLLNVVDTGTGIAARDLEHVFERFYKADSSRTERSGSGTGLGLSIVKEIVDAHGGEVSIESTPEEGTSVHIIFKKQA